MKPENEQYPAGPPLAILAAGQGRRFGKGIKQLVPVGPGGETLMEYSIHDAVSAGFGRIVLIVPREWKEEFRTKLAGPLATSLPVQFVCPDADWGTAYSLLSAEEHLQESFGVINADDYYGKDAFRILAHYLQRERRPARKGCCSMALVAYRLGDAMPPAGSVTRGLCICDEHGRLMDIRETKGIQMKQGGPVVRTSDGEMRLAKDMPVSMNMWGMDASIFPKLREGFAAFHQRAKGNEDEYLIPECVGALISGGQARAELLWTREEWCGITQQEDVGWVRERIRALIRESRCPKTLWEKTADAEGESI